MSGRAIVASVAEELAQRVQMGYDNFKYPDTATSYSDDDADTSESEK